MDTPDLLIRAKKPIRVHLIGEFRVYDIDDVDITPRSAKARCILAILVLEGNSGVVSRNKIRQLLWGRHGHEQSQASLRKSLVILREQLNGIDSELISADRNNIYLQIDNVRVDVDEIDVASEFSSSPNEFDGRVLENLDVKDSEFQHWLASKKTHLQRKIKAGMETHVPVIPIAEQSLYRTSLLKKVKEFWVEGLLNHSLVDEKSIELLLKESPDYLHQPWDGVVSWSHSEPKIFPVDKDILEIFDELRQSMLILGAPGSGKTTLLLNLARKLLQRAEDDDGASIPVVLHLSTWDNEYTNLRDWIIDELDNRYQIPKRISVEMIDDREKKSKQALLLLLDGLDEVDIKAQPACIEAINKFQNQVIPVPVVVSSREGDYTKLAQQLALTGAVLIQPISSTQLDDYLQIINIPGNGLNSAINDNNEIKELLVTPLMLSIASTTYRDYHTGDQPEKTANNTAQERLFFAYARTMFQQGKKNQKYTPEQTSRWLGCMARELFDKKRSLVYLDDLQPNWANTPLQTWIISKGSVYICGLLLALVLNLNLFFRSPPDLSVSLPLSLALTILGCYLSGRIGHGDKIKPIPHVRLSFDILRQRWIFKFVSSVVLAAIFCIGVTLTSNPKIGMTMGVLLFSLLILLNSLDFELIKYQKSPSSLPNEAIRKSLHNALWAAVFGGMLGASIGIFVNELPDVIFISTLLGLICGLFFGGHACIQHYLLRFFFWRDNRAPLRCVTFLEFAVDRAFLYRVGGGYLFIHRSLAEYFAKNC